MAGMSMLKICPLLSVAMKVKPSPYWPAGTTKLNLAPEVASTPAPQLIITLFLASALSESAKSDTSRLITPEPESLTLDFERSSASRIS